MGAMSILLDHLKRRKSNEIKTPKSSVIEKLI
jgi:hypothetical protein